MRIVIETVRMKPLIVVAESITLMSCAKGEAVTRVGREEDLSVRHSPGMSMDEIKAADRRGGMITRT